MPLGCMYAATFGCKSMPFGCTYAEAVGCQVCGCWVQSIWRRLSVNERENPKSRMKMFQSNIYYYVSIKGYIVFTEEIDDNRSKRQYNRQLKNVFTTNDIFMKNK